MTTTNTIRAVDALDLAIVRATLDLRDAHELLDLAGCLLGDASPTATLQGQLLARAAGRLAASAGSALQDVVGNDVIVAPADELEAIQ